MGISISWTKAWSNTDNGTVVNGIDLGNIQTDIASALANAVGLSSNNVYTGTNTFNNTVTFAGSVLGLPTVVVTVTDAVGPTFDASAGDIFSLTATADRTMGAPTNPPAANSKKIIIRHKASGGARTLTLTTGSANSFRFGSDITALSATSSGKTDYIGCVWNLADTVWDVVSVVKGY